MLYLHELGHSVSSESVEDERSTKNNFAGSEVCLVERKKPLVSNATAASQLGYEQNLGVNWKTGSCSGHERHCLIVITYEHVVNPLTRLRKVSDFNRAAESSKTWFLADGTQVPEKDNQSWWRDSGQDRCQKYSTVRYLLWRNHPASYLGVIKYQHFFIKKYATSAQPMVNLMIEWVISFSLDAVLALE